MMTLERKAELFDEVLFYLSELIRDDDDRRDTLVGCIGMTDEEYNAEFDCECEFDVEDD